MSQSYQLIDKEGVPGIKCLKRGLTSYNPKDIAFKYCGNCHTFHDDPVISYGSSGKSMYYKLDRDFNPQPCGRNEFALWCGDYNGYNRRQMADTTVEGIRISTVFLGLDHSFTKGAPILFETMIFGEIPQDNYQRRYRTYKAAIIGHYEAVEEVKATLALLNQADKLLQEPGDEPKENGENAEKR